MLRRFGRLGTAACLAALAGCEHSAPNAKAVASCPFTAADSSALAAAARDTLGKLKAHPQRVTEITPLHGGVAFHTEDADSMALHNGGTVGFDCAKRVTMVWLDGG
jgi:hypothetical protein